MLIAPIGMRAAPTPTLAAVAQTPSRFAYVVSCPLSGLMSANLNTLSSVPQRWELSAIGISEALGVVSPRLMVSTI